MVNVNLSDNVVVVERDPEKLNLAIRTALSEACDWLKTEYLAEFNDVPPIEFRVSSGRKADNYKNGAHVVYHLLSPQPYVSLLSRYVELLDEILSLPAKSGISVVMISSVAFGDLGKIARWADSDHYRVTMRHSLRVALVSLLRQRAVLLPPNIERYLPFYFGVWRGFELMPERLKEMSALYYAGSGLDYGVDWSTCTYTWNGVSVRAEGIEQVPGKNVKALLVQMAMCTRWESLHEIDSTDIYILAELANVNAIGLYMTYLYLKEPEKEALIQNVFPWVETFPKLRIYVEAFSAHAQRAKARRSRSKKQEPGFEDIQIENPCADRTCLKERIHVAIVDASKDGKLDPVLLARALGRISGRTLLRPSECWPAFSVLPDEVLFDWEKEPAHWLSGFRQYIRMKNYANPDQDLNAFVPFMYYLMVYLPIYFHHTPQSDASYPSRIEGLNGYHFISRPLELSDNLPIPYVEFVREYYRESSHERVYTAIQKLHQFFEIILGRREVLRIPNNFNNPVLVTDIPGTGGRHTKTTKRILPRKAYWLALLYAYKIYDYVALVNQRCLEDAVFAEQYMALHRNLDQDDFGLVDIRDILGDDVERVVKFEGGEFEVNVVPPYFFHPVEIPLKGKGPRFVLRPHAITHLICALETGIRNQHVQWLSYDFDKHVQVEEIKTEDVYQLFVMTDKSNKSWTALTAGRVIKVLREMRVFRDLVDVDAFDEKIHYEGRKVSPYPPYRVLFAFNHESGNPHSNGVYEVGFKNLMVGLQSALDHYGVGFDLFKVNEETGCIIVKEGLSPHSMRATVVSEYVQFLSSEYVGRYITNQKLATVWYYTKYDAERLRKLQAEQSRGVAQFSRGNFELRLIDSGGVTIDTTTPHSTLVKAFQENARQAVVDFGAVSSHFFDRETGIGMVTSNRRVTLAFEPTHICPFNRICPADRHKLGLANRCNLCDYAIRTVEHLPSLGCLRRDLLEELEYLETFADENAGNLTEGKERDLDRRISIIAEDLGSIYLAESILVQNLQRLNVDEKAGVIHVYRPEAVLKKLEAMPFPDKEDEARYLLARLVEVQSFPDESRHLLRMKLLPFANNIRANTNNIRESLRRGGGSNRAEAQVYSLVNSLKVAFGFSLDRIAEIASRNVGEMVQLDHHPGLLLSGAEFPSVAVVGAKG